MNLPASLSAAYVLYESPTHKCISFSSLVKGEGVQSNQFLIIHKGRAAVIDPGGDLTYTPLTIELSKHVRLQDLDYVIASHQDPDIISSMPRWLMHTKATVVASKLWARFLPHYDVVRQLVEGGHLGTVHTVFADHGQRLWPGGPQRLSDPALAGGALLDLGIYPASFAQMVLGDLSDVQAIGTLTPEGVDATVSIVARGGDGGAQAILNATMAAKTPTTACVAGDQARIEIDGDFYMPNKVCLVSPDGAVLGTWGYDLGSRHRGLRYEAAEAARRLSAGELESPIMPWRDTLSIMRTLDEVRAQIGVAYPGE